MTGDDPIDAAHLEIPATDNAAGAVAAPRLTTLILLTALAVLPVNTIMPSLPNIAQTFKADFALVNLSIAGYAILTALTELVGGAISDRYGRRPVALASIALFIVASIGCALAPNIGMFLVFRTMQASIAACFSIALVMITETSAEGKATSRFGYLAMGWAIAPMLGPLFGGVLDELFGWRAIFVAFALLGLGAFALSLRGLPETAVMQRRPESSHLSSYRQLLGSQRFWAYTLCMAFSMATLYVFLGGAPLAASELLGGSSAALGFYMGMVPAGFIFGSYLAGRYSSRMSLGVTLILGRLLTCAGLLTGLILSLSGASHVLALFGPCVFIGIGNGLIMPAANSGVLSVRADLAGTAAGLAAAMTIGGAALLASAAGVFLANAHAVHHLLGMLLVPASFALIAAVYAAFIDRRVPPILA